MNKKNEIKKNNKGFSLVELIVVIAIMVVLVAVLAPVFTKYVESSRRATDVQNANSVAEAVLAEVADDPATTKVVSDGTLTALTSATLPSAIADVPAVKGKLLESSTTVFAYKYNSSDNTCSVYISKVTANPAEATDDLTTEAGAKKYRDAKTEADAKTAATKAD